LKTIRYLAYGSNLHPARIGERLDAVRSLGRTTLTGWALRFHKSSTDGSGKCNLIADPAGVAYGAVYEISLADKRRLNTIEGAGNGYMDSTIELPVFGQASVYLAELSYIDDRLAPYDWYQAFVVGGARHHRMPAAYIAQISGTATVRDQDTARRSHNLAILNSIAFPRLRHE
jgi:Gamma-glutamyl cyclotransferase, AIG2-like